MRINEQQALTNEEIQRIAPSAFAGQPYARQSERYAFVPTVAVIDGLRGAGFLPVRASQSLCRIPGKREFTKHMIRFRQSGVNLTSVGDTAVETVLVNSHDGSSAYTLSLGLFRLACLNGMVVSDGLVQSVHVRHVGDIIERVIAESQALIERAPVLEDTVRRWKTIDVAPKEALLLAEAAHSLRFGDNETLAQAIKPEKLLESRRYADSESDLWTTFNRIQENTIKGGVRGYSVNDGRVRHVRSREVKGIDQNNSLNRALWTLAERFAELKGGASN